MVKFFFIGLLLLSFHLKTNARRYSTEESMYITDFTKDYTPNCYGIKELRYFLRINANVSIIDLCNQLSKHFQVKGDSFSYYTTGISDHYENAKFKIRTQNVWKIRIYYGTLVIDTCKDIICVWSIENSFYEEDKMKQSNIMTKNIITFVESIYPESEYIGKQVLKCSLNDVFPGASNQEEYFWKWIKRFENRIVLFEKDSVRTRSMLERELNRIEPGMSFRFGENTATDKKLWVYPDFPNSVVR